MKKIYFSILLLLFSVIFANIQAQVLRVATSPSSIASQIPGYSQVTTINTKTIAYTPSLPPASIAPIDEDSTTEMSKVYEYADVLTANITMANGNITSTTIGKVWTLRVSIPNALNIGLLFNQFNLSATAEMYVFDEAKKVLDSCIKKSHFTSSSSVGLTPITGNSVIIYIVEPNNFGTFQSTISVQKVEAGYQPVSDVGDIGGGSTLLGGDFQIMDASINCNPLVQCQQSKMPFARAVARFTTNGRQGTGTLINNEANNGRAYFLTAFHVVDRNKNGVIDASEIAALDEARFQFQFWRTHCSGSVNNDGIQFSGAVLRASWRNTDVVLLELTNPPGIGDLVNYAGYNRQINSPGNNNGSFVVHHPQGEDMRVTTVSTVNNWFWNNMYWSAHYSSGTVAPGSSGSALMNPSGQIIGQLRSGWSSCDFTDFGDRYGKFNHSWNGAGLQTWLSPNQGLQSTGLLNLTTIPINGPNTIACTSPTQYSTLPNLLGVTYTWSVSAGLQIMSGQGTPTVTISGLPGNQYGSGTLTLTLNSPTKGRIRTYTVSKNITINTGNSISGTYNSPTNPNQPLLANPPKTLPHVFNPACVAFATNMSLPSGSTISWSGPTDPNVPWGQIGNNIWGNFTNYGQQADFTATITNACGTFSARFIFECVTMGTCGIQPQFQPGEELKLSLSPNPTNSILQVVLREQNITEKTKTQNSIKEIRIIDKIGSLKVTQKYRETGNSVNLDISFLKADVYTILVYNGQTWTAEKFIKQ